MDFYFCSVLLFWPQLSSKDFVETFCRKKFALLSNALSTLLSKGFLECFVKSGQVRPGQAKSGQARPGQVSPGQARSGHARSGQVSPGPGQARSGQVRPGQVRSGQAKPVCFIMLMSGTILAQFIYFSFCSVLLFWSQLLSKDFVETSCRKWFALLSNALSTLL